MPDLTRKQKSHALRIARKYVNLKLKLESPFKKELKKYFAEQNRRIAAGLDINSISPILDHHYKRITRKLTGIKLKQDDSEIEDRILIILFGRSVAQAMRIDKTTNKYLRRSIELARAELVESGVLFPDQKSINRIAANIMRGYNNNRVGGIAVFETQSLTEKIRKELTDISSEMMESAILEENQALAQEAADLAESIRYQEIADNMDEMTTGEMLMTARLLEKTWVTMGDKRVRPTHNASNFQTVPINQPFIVGGFELQFPGDSSLGAPLEETAGCRCSAVNL
jgi:hypothetical protein